MNGFKTTKKHLVAATTSHKIFTDNLLSERTFSTLEAMAKLGAKVSANVNVNSNIHSVGQLPVVELGMAIKFKTLKNVGLRAARNKGEGKIRDHTGVKRVGIDFSKNRQSAQNRITKIKTRIGSEWRASPSNGSSGLIQSVLQKGPRQNQKEILQEKINRLDINIIQSKNLDQEDSRKRREIEVRKRSDVEQRANLTPQLRQLKEGKHLKIYLKFKIISLKAP